MSCAQAPPAKGHDGLWGRECYFTVLIRIYNPELVFQERLELMFTYNAALTMKCNFTGSKPE